ncbi:hypothetical protein D3C77_389400 [compost metagenome]
MHRDRRDVLELHVAGTGRHLDAELRQHVVEGLQGERRLGGLVTRAVEPHHQAVADQLVAAHAGNAGNVLQAFSLRDKRDGHQKRGGNQLLEVEHGHPNLERPKRAEEETVEPSRLAGIGKRAGARVSDARISHSRRRHGVVGGNVIGANHAGNAYQLVTGVERQPLLTTHGDDAIRQHVSHGDSDRAGQTVALPGLAVALGRTITAVARTETQVAIAERVVSGHRGAEQRGQTDIGLAVLGDLRVGILARLGTLVEGDGDDVTDPERLAVAVQVLVETGLVDRAVVGRRRQWRARQYRRVVGIVGLGRRRDATGQQGDPTQG